ncbi:MAG: hypothetical protein J6X24_00915, partial [Firmicutes bacterium]|nr:hypothetical protein [Bacillota bacterium]
MKNVRMRKFAVLALCIALVLSAFAGCTKNEAPAAPSVPEALSAPLNIGTLMGPTGMGMAGLVGLEEGGSQL